VKREQKILDYIDWAWFTRGADDRVPPARASFVRLEMKP
jgi:hypothetical protein